MKKILSFVLMLCMLISCVAVADEAPTYTYDVALSEFPTNWNIHQYQTATDAEIVDWIAEGFYGFDYNETLDGYQMEPRIAADFPIDVTAEYVGEKWGIAEGETARAWKIPLRDNLAWQDGTPITAEDFIESYKRLLNPQAQNYRADGMWSGNMVVMNAEAYAKQGVESPLSLSAYMAVVGVESVEELIAQYGDMPGYIDWSYSFGDTYDFAAGAWTGAAASGVVDSGLTLADLYAFYTTGAGAELIMSWGQPAEAPVAWAVDELYCNYIFPETPWENVGMIATEDNAIVFIIEKPLEGFYLYYALTSNYLVNNTMYDACTTVEDGVYTNSYGTTAETTMSYGPYMLTSFQSDKQFVFEKNPYWYGWALEENAGLYQTTHMVYNCVEEPSTRHEMFLSGQLDTFGLSKDYIAEYGDSDYTYYSEGDSVFAMTFNPDFEALQTAQANAGENINKTIITIKDFRIGMSLAMDRSAFTEACDPTSNPAFAVFSSQIIADPDNGIAYRTTEEAKTAVVNFWGLADEIGEDKLYADKDEAIDSITGYNLEMARMYFDSAYDQAIAQGLMDEDDVILIMVGTPNATSTFYNNGYDFIVNNYTEAVKGTKLEGKLTFERDSTLGNGFSDALRNNQVDMLFGVGWTGSTFDPYGLMQVFVDPSYQYDAAWDSSTETVDITVGGVTYTATAHDWYESMQGNTITATITGTTETVELAFPYSMVAEEAQMRIEVLAGMENAVLMNYDFIPLMGDSSASLKGMQIEYYTEDQVFPMGRGGVKYMTYNYTDAEWTAFVAEQGGVLNYK